MDHRDSRILTRSLIGKKVKAFVDTTHSYDFWVAGHRPGTWGGRVHLLVFYRRAGRVGEWSGPTSIPLSAYILEVYE